MTERKARKNHVCDGCYEVIEKGTLYKHKTYPPWQCTPDSDPGYLHIRMHTECYDFFEEDTLYWQDFEGYVHTPSESGESAEFKKRMEAYKNAQSHII